MGVIMWDQPTFDVSGLLELQRQANAMAAQWGAAASATQRRFTGADDAGAVDVVIDESGQPAKVRISPDWARIVGVRGLGAAIVAALQSASHQRLAAWAQAVTEEPAPSTSVPQPSASEPPAKPISAQSLHGLRDLFDLIDGAIDELEQLQTGLERSAAQTDTATNSNHTVRISTLAGAVTAIEFDEEWLRASTSERIAVAVEQALSVSVQRAADRQHDAASKTPSLARAQQLTASPETLLRQAGLIQ
ncbi:hypothetical protein [Actinoplanes sp. N902-109]|uniref:hypothetical protein n=1 Tax=Actinoplanes sp. (strain N902-109) TaxID=649831 RepID=UPI0003294817|nr:hypothetical protein [Actinoplanes sp. N902-109]AGL19148.1 hypothetical protein L083_5638 [Actinoplanes sp. N902-109]